MIDNSKNIFKIISNCRSKNKKLCYVCLCDSDIQLIYNTSQLENFLKKGYSKITIRPNPVEVEVLNLKVLNKYKQKNDCNLIDLVKSVATSLSINPTGYIYPRVFIEISKKDIDKFTKLVNFRVEIVESVNTYQILIPEKSFNVDLFKDLDINIISNKNQQLLVYLK